MGKKEGDIATIVTPTGKRELEVLKLTTMHDEIGDLEGVEEAAKRNGTNNKR